MSDTRVGEAKTVLVFGEGESAVAVISTVLAKARRREGKPSLTVSGPVLFEDSYLLHLQRTVLPLVEQITTSLGVPVLSFDIEVANLNIAAVREKGLTIQGKSADTAIFLAFLSVSLDLPIPQDVVASGQIASSSGEIRLVRHLPAKIDAARRHPEIRCFVHPIVDADSSLKALSPQEREHILHCLRENRDQIELIDAGDIHDLLRAACIEENVLIAALKAGYFLSPGQADSDSAISNSVRFLSDNLEERYWKCLHKNLQAAVSDHLSRLIESRILFHSVRREYPQGFGSRLENVVRSVPPSIRTSKLRFPLIPAETVLGFIGNASPTDLRDVRSLIDAALGDRLAATRATEGEIDTGPMSSEASRLLNTLLSELDPKNLAEKVGIPIDSARGNFVLDSSVAQSDLEFFEIINAFYLHLLRWTHQLVEPVDPTSVAAEAAHCLERAFSRKGGARAAKAEGLDGSQGGMRIVLDAYCEEYKSSQEYKHINWILTEMLEALPYEQKLSVMGEVLEFLRPYLPGDLQDLTPEQLIGREREVIHRLARAISNLRNLLRNL